MSCAGTESALPQELVPFDQHRLIELVALSTDIARCRAYTIRARVFSTAI